MGEFAVVDDGSGKFTITGDSSWCHGSNHFIGGVWTMEGANQSAAGTVAPAPEPSSMALLGSGILGLGGFIRKRMIT